MEQILQRDNLGIINSINIDDDGICQHQTDALIEINDQAYKIIKLNKSVAHAQNTDIDENVTGREFSIIWYNLSYRVNSNNWYMRLKSAFNSTFQTQNQASNTLNPDVDNLSDMPLEPSGRNSSMHVTSSSNQYKTILNKACGSTVAGQLTAILGPSGSGKSSLLHCLYQNKTKGVSGRIMCDGIDTRKKLKVCFIPQKDYLIEYLTVREDLTFVYKLRASSDKNCMIFNRNDHASIPSTMNIHIETIAELLGLSTCLDVKIGNISGGQQKRLSIAREIMANPDILILDEPTTGLDSLSCMKVVQVLKNITTLSKEKMKPLAIVLVVHQPQTEVFNLFDKVYFISKNGKVIYNDSPKNVIETLRQKVNLELPSPNYSPASFLIEIASGELGLELIDKLYMNVNLAFKAEYNVDNMIVSANSRLIKKGNLSNQTTNFSSTIEEDESSIRRIDRVSHDRTSDYNIQNRKINASDNDDSQKYYMSPQLRSCLSSHSIDLKQSFRHIFILMQRAALSTIRNPSLFRSRLIFHIAVPLIVALVFGSRIGKPNACPRLIGEIKFSDIRDNIENGVISKMQDDARLTYENMGFFFILIFAFSLNVIILTSSLYPLTMQMFRKETINGLYRPTPYLIAQTLVELPIEILLPSISVIMIYHLTGQISSYLQWRMFTLAFGVSLTCYIFHAIGLMFGAIFINNVNASLLLAQISVLPFAALSGFLLRPTKMDHYARIFSYISPYKLGLEIAILSRYGFNTCPCDEDIDFTQPPQISGMNNVVRKTLDYMFEVSNRSIETTEEDILPMSTTVIFDKLSLKYSKGQSYGFDINSCDDVKPFVMMTFGLDDISLYYRFADLLIILLIIKVITFSVVHVLPYRMNS